MKVGDLVSYKHAKSGSTLGVVLYVRKKYVISGPPERARVRWNTSVFNDEELEGLDDWVDDLEVISEANYTDSY